MKHSLYVLILLFVVIQIQVRAQDEYKALLESKRYTFEAESMTPQRGGMRQLTPGYAIKVTGDTVVVDLPYIGRAYNASYNTDDAGMTFTSRDFEHAIAEKKKGGWRVTIRPKDVRSSPRINLDVSKTGRTTVNITSADKAAISYYGNTVKPKK